MWCVCVVNILVSVSMRTCARMSVEAIVCVGCLSLITLLINFLRHRQSFKKLEAH